MENIFILDGKINYFGKGEKKEVSREEKKILELGGFFDGVNFIEKEKTIEEKILEVDAETEANSNGRRCNCIPKHSL